MQFKGGYRGPTFHVFLCEEELKEVLAAMEFAADQKFYGEAENEPWNIQNKLAFTSALEKIKRQMRRAT